MSPALAELEERLEASEQTAAENLDRMQRALAELDNLRKRTQREQEEFRQYATESLLTELLPILDNFALAFDSVPDGSDSGWLDGMRLVRRQLEEVLARFGLERVETVGRIFDPREHEAIANEEPNGVPDHTVTAELRPGYRLRGRMLRPALVRVAQAG
ncbi:MAG: nucleotide exchange factor GrpE [Candidatus Dormibacteria bacterium]